MPAEKNLGFEPSHSTYVQLLANNDITQYISNIHTRIYCIETENTRIPITSNTKEYENSYVCSPYTAYFTYTYKEILNLKWGVVGRILGGAVLAIGQLARYCRFNRVIQLDNFLYSTNLHPKLSGDRWREVVHRAFSIDPSALVMMRSLIPGLHDGTIQSLQAVGFQLIPARQVFLFDFKSSEFLKKRMNKSDAALLRKSKHVVVNHENFSDKDLHRSLELYNLLYIEKHSELNPRFTFAFVKFCHEQRVMEFCGLRNPETLEIDAVVAYVVRDEEMVTHFIGYDARQDESTGLYRMIVALLFQRASKLGILLNFSSGSGKFKHLRGGIPTIEFNAVYLRNAPYRTRMLYKLVQSAAQLIGVPIMRKFIL